MEKLDTTKFRCNVTMPRWMVDEIDELSSIFGTNRSVMISMICKTYLDQQKVINITHDIKKLQDQQELEALKNKIED